MRFTIAREKLQEALTNVARHSQASRVSIALELQNGGVYLRMDDDGGGIEEDKIFDEIGRAHV